MQEDNDPFDDLAAIRLCFGEKKRRNGARYSGHGKSRCRMIC
jgi:hypothetical protein